MKLLALIVDTFREIYAKKVIVGIVVIEVLALLVTALVLFSDGMQESYEAIRLRGEMRMEIDTTIESDTAPDSATPEFVERDDSLLGELETSPPGVRSDTLGLLDSDSTPELDDSAGSSTFAAPPPALEGENDGAAETFVNGDTLLNEAVKAQLAAYAVMIAAAVLFLGIFATAGIVPSMMEKGTIDLLISKPLRRTELLLGRALGGVIAVGLNLLGFLIALWALYGLATGVWYVPFIGWTFLLSMFAFITLYSGIIALNVFTESWVLPMSLAYIHMTVLSTFLSNREATLYQLISADWLRGIIETLYWALPQVQDVVQAIPLISFSGVDLPWASFAQCLAFTMVMLALAAWTFERRDF